MRAGAEQAAASSTEADTAARARAEELETQLARATAEAAQHRGHADQLQVELDDVRQDHSLEEQLVEATARIGVIEAELSAARKTAGGLAAELDEAQTRADTLAEVVRVESAHREQNRAELTTAQQTVERLERELREREGELARARRDAAAQAQEAKLNSVSAAAEAQARETAQAEVAGAAAHPPAPRPVAAAQCSADCARPGDTAWWDRTRGGRRS